jgi:hypothetical protein
VLTDGKRKVLDPVLAVAWGKAVYLLQVVTGKIKSRPNQLDFIPIAEYYTDSNVTGFQWLGMELNLYAASSLH